MGEYFASRPSAGRRSAEGRGERRGKEGRAGEAREDRSSDTSLAYAPAVALPGTAVIDSGVDYYALYVLRGIVIYDDSIYRKIAQER